MKKFNLTIFSIFLAVGLNAQWTRTNVDTMDTGIEAMCEHNGSLYASIYFKGLVKFDETLNQWQTVSNSLPPTSNSAHIVNMASIDNYLYAYVNDQYHASTTIYRSSDDGVTFETDTIGHPRNGPFPASTAGYTALVQDVFAINGLLYNVMGGVGYTKKPSDVAWTAVTDPKIKFAEIMGEYNNTWYIYGDNYKLNTSIDSGQTWNTPANTDLPPSYNATILNVNATTGRVYLSGFSSAKHKLMYSDNEGVTWDSLPINQYLDLDFYGQTQSIQDLIANGNDVTAFCYNDALNTKSDIFKSTDGGQTFAKDTVGLPNDPWGAEVVQFTYFKNNLWMALNSPDIYKQGAGTTSINKISKVNIQVYPNPAHSYLQLHGIIKDQPYIIYDMSGREMKNGIISGAQKIDLQDIPTGMYFLKIENEMTIRFVKD